VTEVVVYSRPGCHLCEEALEAIVGLGSDGYRFTLREVDIDSEDRLLRELLERIPVVEVDGEPVSELILDVTALRARLDTVGVEDGAGGGGA
jgi:glutaredoxin